MAIERARLDELLDEGGPFDELDVDLDADLLEALLDELGDLLPLVIALIGPDGEGEWLPVRVLDEPVTVAEIGRASCRERVFITV